MVEMIAPIPSERLKCPECGAGFIKRKVNQTFCTGACRINHNNKIMLSWLHISKRPIIKEAIEYANSQGRSFESFMEESLSNTLNHPIERKDMEE